MKNVVEMQDKNLSLLKSEQLPEIASIEILQKFADASLYKGLRVMSDIISEAEENADKINATKTVLGIAKFVSDRLREEGPQGDELIDDFDEVSQIEEVNGKEN